MGCRPLHEAAGEPGISREAAENIRLFICGSAPLLPSTFAEFEQRIGQPILERYGMSEAAIITTNPLHGARLAGSVGYPLPGVDLVVADDGIVQIKGPSVTSGYWRKPEKTAEAFAADGYFITGDIGRLDEDGRLWLSGRSSDLIISGGLNVYPKEIELVLDEMAGVLESAVIGCPHPISARLWRWSRAKRRDEAAISPDADAARCVQMPKRVFRRRPAAQHHGQGAEGRAAADVRDAVQQG